MALVKKSVNGVRVSGVDGVRVRGVDGVGERCGGVRVN